MARTPRVATAASSSPTSRGANSAPEHRVSASDLVANHIRRLIYEGSLKQGDHLRQDDIAAELGVSRIPVREAVIALDREGWLSNEPHRGAFVNGLDVEVVRDHYELLGFIYGLAARRATQRGTLPAVKELAAAQKALQQSTTPEEVWVADSHFWRLLFSMGKAHRLASLARMAGHNLVPGNFFENVPGTVAIQKRGVAAVTKAVRAGDPVGAEQECHKLMQRSGDCVVSLLVTRQDYRKTPAAYDGPADVRPPARVRTVPAESPPNEW